MKSCTSDTQLLPLTQQLNKKKLFQMTLCTQILISTKHSDICIFIKILFFNKFYLISSLQTIRTITLVKICIRDKYDIDIQNVFYISLKTKKVFHLSIGFAIFKSFKLDWVVKNRNYKSRITKYRFKDGCIKDNNKLIHSN